VFHLRDADQRVTRLAGELLWARDGVGGGLVGIVGDASVRALVGAGEGNETAGLCASTTGDLELMATRVELGTRVLVCGVQRNNFVANEVVARGNALGDSVGDGTTRDLESVGAPDI
jgi:hypothetical protein